MMMGRWRCWQHKPRTNNLFKASINISDPQMACGHFPQQNLCPQWLFFLYDLLPENNANSIISAEVKQTSWVPWGCLWRSFTLFLTELIKIFLPNKRSTIVMQVNTSLPICLYIHYLIPFWQCPCEGSLLSVLQKRKLKLGSWGPLQCISPSSYICYED